MGAKQTSYQKLKTENKQLREDIYNLIESKSWLDGEMVRMKYKVQYAMNKAIWGGEPTKVVDWKSKPINK